MARLVKVMEVPPTVKVRPLEKPRPDTKMTAAMIRFLDFVKSTWFSTILRTPIAGDHTVKDEADTTDNGSRHRTDDRGNLWDKT